MNPGALFKRIRYMSPFRLEILSALRETSFYDRNLVFKFYVVPPLSTTAWVKGVPYQHTQSIWFPPKCRVTKKYCAKKKYRTPFCLKYIYVIRHIGLHFTSLLFYMSKDYDKAFFLCWTGTSHCSWHSFYVIKYSAQKSFRILCLFCFIILKGAG